MFQLLGHPNHHFVECFSYSDRRTMILSNVSAVGTCEPWFCRMFQLLGHVNHDSIECFSSWDMRTMILSNVSALRTSEPSALDRLWRGPGAALERLWRVVWCQKHWEAKVAVVQVWRTKCAGISVYAVARPLDRWRPWVPLLLASKGPPMKARFLASFN